MGNVLYGIVFVKGKQRKRVLSIAMRDYAALSLWMKEYLKQEPNALEAWDGYEIVEVG